VLEDLLDRAEAAAGTGPGRAPARGRRGGTCCGVHGVRGRPTAVPPGGPAWTARCPGSTFADAHAVEARPAPDRPAGLADAVFRDPPWVVGAPVGAQAVVGLVGIERGDSSAFATLAAPTTRSARDGRRAPGLPGERAPRAAAVVVSTVVRLRNARGRAYFAVVRPVHPVVVRAMLARAAGRLSRSSNTGPRRLATMEA
jgi:hypothetical protein